ERRNERMLIKHMAEGGADKVMQCPGVAEAHLSLCGMDIDVHLIGRQFEKKKDDGVPAGHQQAVKCVLNGVAQRAVANPAAIDEEILQPGVAAIDAWIGDKAREPGWPCFGGDRQKLVAHFAAKKEADAAG